MKKVNYEPYCNCLISLFFCSTLINKTLIMIQMLQIYNWAHWGHRIDLHQQLVVVTMRPPGSQAWVTRCAPKTLKNCLAGKHQPILMKMMMKLPGLWGANHQWVMASPRERPPHLKMACWGGRPPPAPRLQSCPRRTSFLEERLQHSHRPCEGKIFHQQYVVTVILICMQDRKELGFWHPVNRVCRMETVVWRKIG